MLRVISTCVPFSGRSLMWNSNNLEDISTISSKEGAVNVWSCTVIYNSLQWLANPESGKNESPQRTGQYPIFGSGDCGKTVERDNCKLPAINCTLLLLAICFDHAQRNLQLNPMMRSTLPTMIASQRPASRNSLRRKTTHRFLIPA